MNFPINSASENKKYSINPQKTAEHTSMPKQDLGENKKNKSVHNGTNKILAGLSGLGVIGLSIVLISKSKKNSVTKKLVNQTDGISGIKNKIKNDYLTKKSKVIEDCKSNVVDEKEIQKYNKMKNEVSAKIKSTLKDLQPDSEWVELRKIRKSLLKTLNTDKKTSQHDVASKKIELANNICSLNEFNTAFYAKQKYDFDFAENEKFFYKECNLTLKDLFPDDMKKYDYANEKIKELNLEPKTKLHEKLVELAKEFQTSEDVKKMKNLNKTETQTAPIIA